MEKFANRYNVEVYAFALMPNHFHLLIETPDANLSAFMHALKSAYANHFNFRHKRAGHLFQGRFKAHVVEKESYLLELHRYIHLNPVRAGLVERPEQWRWSSYAEFIRPRSRIGWLWRDEALEQFGRSSKKAIALYRELVEDGLQTPPVSPFQRLVAGAALGGEEFCRKIGLLLREKHLRPPRHVSKFGKITRWNKREADDALSKIAGYFKIDREKLTTRNRTCLWQRDLAMAVFVQRSRWPLEEIGEVFSVGGSAVCKAAERVELAMSTSRTSRKEREGLYSIFNA